MRPDAADNSVPREISALLSNRRLILRETQRAVTPLGGVAVFVAFLHKLGFVEKLRQHMPIQWKSPNHIDPTATFIAFLVAVLAGARRFAHANWLRGDRALHALLGLSRFPIDDTIRNLPPFWHGRRASSLRPLGAAPASAGNGETLSSPAQALQALSG